MEADESFREAGFTTDIGGALDSADDALSWHREKGQRQASRVAALKEALEMRRTNEVRQANTILSLDAENLQLREALERALSLADLLSASQCGESRGVRPFHQEKAYVCG